MWIAGVFRNCCSVVELEASVIRYDLYICHINDGIMLRYKLK